MQNFKTIKKLTEKLLSERNEYEGTRKTKRTS